MTGYAGQTADHASVGSLCGVPDERNNTDTKCVEGGAVDEPELADLDPFALMAAEALRIDTFYARLSAEEWLTSTRCVGWNRRDLMAHLAAVEDCTSAGLRGDVQTLVAASGAGGLDDFNAWGIGRRAELSAQELLETWRMLVAENDAALRERGPHGTTDTSMGAYPIGRHAFYLASERAIHADDAGVPITADEAPGRLDWQLRFARAAVTESRRGGRVSVVSHRGAQVVRLGALEVRLSDEQFVAAVSGRLPTAANIPHRMRKALAVLA